MYLWFGCRDEALDLRTMTVEEVNQFINSYDTETYFEQLFSVLRF